MRVCVEWAEESYDECARYEDRGYNACSRWDDRCCTWWPCSWGCKLITWICVAWVWVSNLVCVLWTTITTLVCLVWRVVQVILTPIAWLVELITSIPIIGRLIDEILNVVQEIFWRIVGLPDALLGLLGIRPLKKLRLCVIILREEDGTATATEAALQPFIASARSILRDEANIHLILEGVHTVADPTPGYALDVGCNIDAWGEDLWLTGTYFELTSAWACALGATSRVVGYGNQIVAFAVRSIPGTTAGCALGPAVDYLTIEGPNPICLAHEIGHKVGLWHCCPRTNLANGNCGGTQLRWWQRTIVRNSKYVTYL